MLSSMAAIWLWNWGDGVRYAIEPCTEGGYDSVVEIGLQGSIDREHWDTLDAAKARFHDELEQRADGGTNGAAKALAELEALDGA
jgi:hypothetical protein